MSTINSTLFLIKKKVRDKSHTKCKDEKGEVYSFKTNPKLHEASRMEYEI